MLLVLINLIKISRISVILLHMSVFTQMCLFKLSFRPSFDFIFRKLDTVAKAGRYFYLVTASIFGDILRYCDCDIIRDEGIRSFFSHLKCSFSSSIFICAAQHENILLSHILEEIFSFLPFSCNSLSYCNLDYLSIYYAALMPNHANIYMFRCHSHDFQSHYVVLAF